MRYLQVAILGVAFFVGGFAQAVTIEELPIDEMWVGHRPGSRDDAPILGPSLIDGLVYATGHHRNGILLAPITADTIARLVLDGVVDATIRPLGMERFMGPLAAE